MVNRKRRNALSTESGSKPDELYTLQVIVRYAISLEEYVESQRAYRVRMARDRLFFRNLYGLACVAATLGIYLRLLGSGWWGAALFLVAGVLLLERALLWRLRVAAAYRATAGLREPVELQIEESNLVRTSAAGSEEIRWANILACHETRDLFLLRLAPDELMAIPKRAFSPGDLFRFKELRQKELIVETTRDNPDIVLLRFVATWGLVAMAVIALFIGYVDNFLSGLPRNPQARRSPVAGDQPAPKSPPASPAELRGNGTVYLVPLGTIKSVSVPLLLQDIQKRYGLQLQLLSAVSPSTWAKNTARKQFVAEDLVTLMKLAYPKLAADPGAVLIGITDEDMYISELDWTYAFSFRDEEHFAIISNAHLSEGEDEKPAAPEVVQARARKVLMRDLGILHYRLQPSDDYNSILYGSIDDATELDDIGEDYLESDVQTRADLHVENGEPCFVVRHYTLPERQHADLGTVTGCVGAYKETNLETVQIDLRYGLLLDQRTDFLVTDKIPLELTRVLRTQDPRSRAFGVGGSHNLNLILVGDKWPFTWIDLVLEHGGRAHFRRSNWGFGYWDARYTNRDPSGSNFSGSTIDWAWPGWRLKNRGMTYQFPDGGRAERPEQTALVGIQTYGGARLALGRDKDGNLLQVRSPAGHELVFKYDRDHRVIEINQKDGGRFVYSYDAAGHLARATDADQRVTEYGYDQAGRLNRVLQNGVEICTLGYDSAERVTSETLAGGRTYRFSYSLGGHGEVNGVDIWDSAGPVRRVRISDVDYSLDVLPKSEQYTHTAGQYLRHAHN
ncbi:MAG: YcxB family protein [Acidobacteriia bacterium]|nr:YcxB family protein [Terriglobia bacterium]